MTTHDAGPDVVDVEAWAEVLDRLERDVAQSEELARTGGQARPVEAWVPPVLRGPLPDELLDRARTLLDRQLAARSVLAAQVLENRAQQQAHPAPRHGAHAATAAPAYVDVSA